MPPFGWVNVPVSVNIESFAGDGLAAFGAWAVSPAVYGGWGDELPVETVQNAWTGQKVPSYLEELYYRIHLYPARVDFGPIVNQVQTTFYVWNAYLVAKTLAAIQAQNAEGLSMDVSAPAEFKSLEQKTVTLTASTEGPASFEATFTFDFTDANDVVFTATGIRIFLLGWRPQAPMIERLEWKTMRQVSRSGREQRMALRRAPRQSFEITVLLTDKEDIVRMLGGLHRWQDRAWGFPIWTEAVEHTADIQVNDSQIILDTSNADFREGGLLAIWQHNRSHTIATIQSIVGTTVTLDSPIQTAWTGPKLIMPCRTVAIHQAVPIREFIEDLMELRLGLLVEDNLELTGYTPAMSYDGRAVVTEPTYVDGSIDRESNALVVISDFETGKPHVFSDRDFELQKQAYTVHKEARAACWEFRRFLHSLHGMRDTFWLPTFRAELELYETATDPSTSFKVQARDFVGHYATGDPLKNHLMAVFSDGQRICRRITGIATDTTWEVVTVDAPFGRDLVVGQVTLHWLDRVRLAADAVEIRWDRVDVLEATLQVEAVTT